MTATSIHSRRGMAVFLFLAFVLWLVLHIALSAIPASAEAQSTIIYVNAAASPGGNGSSWAAAYTSLQDALDEAVAGDEIWVAVGVYTPGANVEDSFNIPSGVAVYGGFVGGELERDRRDWEANPTVLSGDIGGDDGVDARGVVTDTANIVGDNAYHVVTLDGITTPILPDTRLDGVIITAGQANGSYPRDLGGGLYCNGSGAGHECNPTLTNVTFSGNSAEYGGAMFNHGEGGQSSPVLTNVTFVGNWAAQRGGAMYNDGRNGGESSPTLTNVIFAGNQTVWNGGAMFNDGGGMDGQSSPALTNVTFAGNRAEDSGGAMFNYAYFWGESSPILTNVTFSGNSAPNGGAMFNDGGGNGESSPLLTNVILWENSAGSGAVMYNNAAMPTIAYSLVQGGWDGSGITNNGGGVTDGGGNIDADPLFVTPIDPDDAPTTAGNLRLLADSPAIDAGDNDALPPGLTTDLDGNPRIVGDAVDMGAYELQRPMYLPLLTMP